ncbi:hypothetical protein DESUT3_33280 [Desulfuromonas versatilis]|uniref:SH3b domain-containing protein n=1 Tax=Desulfuromonas versatilis TaxID=2802975 RepID=A0ABM8HWB9_9BACT|nr:DUF6515 family protein [Desulfuromonas versatilis]BCR06259.1 hypothetical protein DESUT3_33280 [Desulfuromonas versatilis]
MKKKLGWTIGSFLTLAWLFLPLLAGPGEALAGGPASPPHRVEVFVKRLPAGHKVIHVGKTKYFVHGGRFYRGKPGGYVAVTAPIGAVVNVLPSGFSTVTLGGTTFFLAGGVYYRQLPGGYMVVEAPTPEPLAEGHEVIVQVAVLNVRSGPGAENPVVHQVSQGVHLSVVGNALGWYYVRLPGGHHGWVMGKFVSPVQPLPRG